MVINNVKFYSASGELKQLPKDTLPEFAFVGRSNVGKSSFINCICGRKKLAKVSGTPGKTQTINHYLVDENWYLVDLPGYGYAKVSKKQRHVFSNLMKEYLQSRWSLVNVFSLVDCRVDPQEIDLEFMEFMGENEIPFSIVFTKSDKLSKNKLRENLEKFKARFLETWEELPPVFVTSAETGDGTEEVLSYIDELIPLFVKK